MKSVVAKILAVTICLSVFGCTPNDNVQKASVPELVWIVPGDEQKDTDMVLEKANEIVEQKLGVRLKLEFIPQEDYEDEMKMYMASEADYDLCFTSNWLNNYDSAVKNGALYDITELLDNTPELKQSIPEYVFKSIGYDGRIYAMPNLQIMVQQLALQVRADLVDKYDFKLDEVNTMDDIEPFLETIKKNEPNIYPYRARWGISPWIYNQLEEFGNTAIFYDYNTNEIKPYWENPDVHGAIARLRDWYKKGYIRKDIDTQGDDDQLYYSGAYAVCVTSWKPGMETLEKSKYSKEYIYKRIGKARKLMLTGEAAMTAVGANSKMPRKAFELLKLINTDRELYTLICNGIEGIHYTINHDGKMQNIPGSGYNPNADWKFGNQFNAYIKEDMDYNVWEETQRLNDEAIGSPLLGFKIDKTSINAEMSNIIAVNEEYRGEEYVNFIVSDDYDDYINEYKEKMKNAGIDKVVAEISRQAYDYVNQQEE